VVKQTELLERDAELATLSAAVSSARESRGRGLCVVGRPGVGKTRLIAAVHELGEQAGLRVLSARGGELERDYGYGVVRQLFEPAVLALDDREQKRAFDGAAALARAVFGEVGPADTRGSEFASIHGLYWLTVNLAAAGPLLIAVDDVHWSDLASARWLRYLARRLEGLPVLLALAARPAEPGSSQEWLEEMLVEDGVEVLMPGELSQSAVAEAVARRFDGSADPDFVHAAHEVTGGNPFMLEEVLRELASLGVAADSGALSHLRGVGPTTIARSVLVRLGRLGGDARQLAMTVAVLGGAATLRRAAKLAGLDSSAAEHAADAMVGAEVLRGMRPLEFVHPVVRAAIYRDLAPVARAGMHARAAHLLSNDGGTTDEIAAHLLASEPAGEDWITSTLHAAARAALARGTTDPAVRYLRRALEEPPQVAERAEILLELGSAEARLGDPEAIRHLEEALAMAPAGSPRARAALALGHAQMVAGRVREATSVITAALEKLDEQDRELTLELGAGLITIARADVRLRHLIEQWMPRLREAASGGGPADRLILARDAFDAVLRSEPADEVAARVSELKLIDVPWSEQNFFTVLETVWVLILAERVEEAHAALRALERRASARGLPAAATTIACCRGLIALRFGTLQDAEAELHGAIELAVEYGVLPVLAVALSHMALTLTELGRAAEAEQAFIDSPFPGWMIDVVPLTRTTRGFVRLASGRLEEAIDDLLAGGRSAAMGAQDAPVLLNWRCAAADAMRGLGGREAEALALVDEDLELARRSAAPRAIGIALRARALLHDGAQQIELLEESLAALESSRAALERARTRIELGAALRRGNQRSAAREQLQVGLEEAVRAGAAPLAERAREELLATGARPRRVLASGVDSLTASERRAARLAAEGLSNREIAQRLFVTVKTVEDHLSATYRKLGITSRKQLAGALEATLEAAA
jgi:DNA-binding CsgD family transcriptional regulator